ncbi:MAG: minor capsid protein, partial [Selenomonadaceae bacterium]|nr:minor capsid protein [Selenomonadaceae bacterium]
QTRAAADSIIAAEMGYYQFIAVMDNRTTPMCQSLDGEIFPIVELNQGENAPPMHVRCRSTICASIDDGKQGRKPTGQRAARDEDGKRIKIPADMRYADWKAVYIDKTKTLDDWRKAKDAEYKAVYVNKSPKFEKAKYRVAAKVRPLEEFLLMAKELQPIAEKYTGCKSLWSGKIVLTEKSLKNWDCNIWLWDDAPKHVLLHEMIHSCSVSYYSQDVFAAYKFEEELVVQYLCQEISQKEKIEIIAGGYDKGVELLRKIKRSLNLNISDLAFAQNLIKQPLGNRWEYLESLTINAATIEDYLKAIRQIEVLKKWKVLKKEN